jgi:hypothetical protein
MGEVDSNFVYVDDVLQSGVSYDFEREGLLLFDVESRTLLLVPPLVDKRRKTFCDSRARDRMGREEEPYCRR